MRHRKIKFLSEIFQLEYDSKQVPEKGNYFLFELEDYPWEFEIKKAVKDDPFDGQTFYIYRYVGWGEYFYRKRGNQYEIYHVDNMDMYECKCQTKEKTLSFIDKLNHYNGILNGHSIDLKEYKKWSLDSVRNVFEKHKSEVFMASISNKTYKTNYLPYSFLKT